MTINEKIKCSIYFIYLCKVKSLQFMLSLAFHIHCIQINFNFNGATVFWSSMHRKSLSILHLNIYLFL